VLVPRGLRDSIVSRFGPEPLRFTHGPGADKATRDAQAVPQD
jgi:hypothetical protein